MKLNKLLGILMLLFVIQSCTVYKKHYSNGYRIIANSKSDKQVQKKYHNVPNELSITSLAQEKEIVSTVSENTTTDEKNKNVEVAKDIKRKVYKTSNVKKPIENKITSSVKIKLATKLFTASASQEMEAKEDFFNNKTLVTVLIILGILLIAAILFSFSGLGWLLSGLFSLLILVALILLILYLLDKL